MKHKKSKMMSLFTILPLLVYVVNTIINGIPTAALSDSLSKGNETDRLALLAIKSMITHNPHGLLSSWNESAHFCLWEGVICGRRHRRVTALDLSSSGLVGSLSPAIGNLSFLRDLDMSNNTFNGRIPPEIGRLFRMQTLVLANNSFEGGIPANISGCLRLYLIQLSYNKLAGNIPSGFSLLSKLEFLGLGANNLTGDDLSPLRNLTSLQILSISLQNQHGGIGFHGRIPDFIGNFKNLTYLALGSNSFTDQIPSSLYNLSNLQTLSLGDNQLEGVLPPDFGFHFPQLQVLQMSFNKLSGPIPFSLSNLSNLEMLDMNNNNFTGKILLDGRKMPKLSILDLDNATMGRGEIDELDFINTLVNCTNLQVLDVDENNLGGTLPHSIANLSVHLRALDLQFNLISGSIPSGLGNLLSLQWLGLALNQLTGAIPTDIGKIPNLETIFIQNNILSGRIPLSIGNLTWLSKLSLSHNKFQGLVPDTLGNCKNLLKLYLDHNKLVGYVPHKLYQASGLVELKLQENMLQGSLTSEIGELKNLLTVDISNNNLSGNIPTSLGQCLDLTYLYLEGNSFNGGIPPSFSRLQGLQEVDLSRNKLSGQVPKYFNFSSLTYLNLSFNNLEGEVPTTGVYTNVSAISLIGNDKLCGGIPELNLPKCTMTKSKVKKKSRVLVLAVSISCFLGGLSIVVFAYLVCKKSRKQQASSESMNKESFIKVSYDMLLKATNGFSPTNLIGSGSFSSVYEGTLLIDGTEKSVAIKVINNQRQGASQSFLVECEALRVIHHRNLVGVLTACSSIDFQGNVFNAIVYELMSKGSLERWLYLDSGVDDQFQSLNLLQRLNIAIDVAHAVDYIHSVCKTPFVHCDLKPSNILLDDDLVAHVGDFGLVKLPPEIAKELPNYISLGVRGTVGYTAPEYGVGTSMSAAGDVYSYGIILLELITAKKPTDVMFEGDMNLHRFAESSLFDHVQDILDPKLEVNDKEERSIDLKGTRLITKCALECITSMIKIGVMCSSELPQDRMDIKDAIRQLQLQKDQILLFEKHHRCQITISGK